MFLSRLLRAGTFLQGNIYYLHGMLLGGKKNGTSSSQNGLVVGIFIDHSGEIICSKSIQDDNILCCLHPYHGNSQRQCLHSDPNRENDPQEVPA